MLFFAFFSKRCCSELRIVYIHYYLQKLAFSLKQPLLADKSDTIHLDRNCSYDYFQPDFLHLFFLLRICRFFSLQIIFCRGLYNLLYNMHNEPSDASVLRAVVTKRD